MYSDTTTDYRPANAAADAQNFQVSPNYFRAAGTAMLAGRSFTMQDQEKAPKVAVVNREFARKLFGSVDKAIGPHFKFWGGQGAEVIGVVEDGKYETLTEDQKPAMFFSFLQQQDSDVWILVRSERDPQEIAAALQRSMRGLDPALPIEIKTWNSEMDSALFASRVATVALGVLSLLGAMLAVTGIFGMASYTVSKRIRELGLRVAPGANQRKVLGAALGWAFRLLAIGPVGGIILGVLATRVLSSIVYQATPRDPLIPRRGRPHHALCGHPRRIDPGLPRSRCRSDGPAARGMNWRTKGWGHYRKTPCRRGAPRAWTRCRLCERSNTGNSS